ncbi:hypothetical protein EDC04DRAFT_2610697 [Pisolithus marmoratus]|nr:hypothetical protein EDC04DRAFT_2610697 [Pisolithus marmoratus]
MPSFSVMTVLALAHSCEGIPWTLHTWQEITGITNGLFPNDDHKLPTSISRADAVNIATYFDALDEKGTRDKWLKFLQARNDPYFGQANGVSMTWLDSLKTNFGCMKKTAKEHREAVELAYLVASADITVKKLRKAFTLVEEYTHKEEEHHFEHLLGQLSALLEVTSWGKFCIKPHGSGGLSKYTGLMLEQLAGEEDMADLEAKCHCKELWVTPKIKLGAPATIFDLSFLNICMDEAHHMHNVNSKYWAVLAMCDRAVMLVATTATPLHMSPKDLIALGRIIGIMYSLSQEPDDLDQEEQ